MVRKVERVKIDRKRFRERASYFRRLAVGVAGDPQFTVNLSALADEYEAMAVKADGQAASDQSGTVETADEFIHRNSDASGSASSDLDRPTRQSGRPS